ncbi:MAG: tRNA guanosine(34) transglycosylase Tgt [Desulfobacterales bacterium]|uniref:Queuine tRNA-ribosyltransferase n=1 Tax=Candidatus Desulfatibia vada TaxID=2841696 RepID=A0A8J6TM59_9BACT|nr:tRNA guanosine(34) transglycosylase Tgt [Candidatus Desulfatibia vada]
MFSFKVIAESGTTRARAGLLQTAHGAVETPVFMPVGTLGTVKSLSPEELFDCEVGIILGNTYHLYLRPGCEVIRRFSGLHNFMHWDGAILTDSGGFQVFSLAKLRTITEEGVTFQSHIDGSQHVLTPEKAIEIQICLGSDIMMCLDECIQYPVDRDNAKGALELTTRWAARCKQIWQEHSDSSGALFGIVQGGMFKDLRAMSADALLENDFSGYAVGGLSVGEPKDLMFEIADFTLPRLPDAKPKYIMGTGTPADLIELVALGADMFDCVLPTRNARNGQMFTKSGTMNIYNSRFKDDPEPVEAGCRCYTCQNYSKAYLRHLYMAKELLAYRLNTIHNIHFYISLMKRVRKAICKDRFSEFRKAFYAQRESE